LRQRTEVKQALSGVPSAYTRIREREPSVFLFVAEPLYRDAAVVGAVYVTRSTRPVMVELYRIRSGLQQVLLVALVFTVGVTLWLGYSITRPLERLSAVASRIAAGQTNLDIPVTGTGEVRELGSAFATMTERLQTRMHDTVAFAADVAHAFKSPLTSIRGAAELLAQGAADDPRARERFLHNIELDSERLDRLVSRLLQLSRIEASTGPFERVALHTVVANAAERSATPDVEVTLEEPLPEAFVWGRREDLETALANLCDNAVKFSPEGGRVRIGLVRGEERHRVSVEDDGPGVPVDVQPRLFQRFFTTDVDQGTGLGLAIVKSVADAHGGRVFLDANVDRGARFVLELPAGA
jgi:two-component system sensor histidine kinase ChvG